MKSVLQSEKDRLALSTLFSTQTHGSSMISRTELILAATRMASKLFLGMLSPCPFFKP